MIGLFHLFSNGSTSADLFTSGQELDDAMNRIAVVTVLANVLVLAFSIQDTHVHLLVKGEMCDVIKFMREYQKRTRDALTRTRSNSNLENFSMEMLAVTDDGYAKRVASYIVCQATKDGKRVMPYDYRWSSASLYFRTTKNDLLWRLDNEGNLRHVMKMGELSIKKQKALFHVNKPLPEYLDVCDGIILPSSFVSIADFERIYLSHNCFRTFLGGSATKDMEIINETARASGIGFEEHEAREMAKELCQKMFLIKEIRKLDIMQRLELGRGLRREFKMSLSQIARRIYLPEDEVRKYIH